MKISTALQANAAPLGIHKVSGAVGLYLKVGESGSTSWFWRYRLGGKRREFGLGSSDAATLAAARDAARDAAALVRKGVDPIEQRRTERRENLAKSRVGPSLSFEQMAKTYLTAHGSKWKHRHARAVWLNPLIRYAVPTIGKLGLEQIEISHIIEIMEAAEKAGAPEVARRVRARIEQVLNAAIALSGKAVRNPADGKLIAAAHPTERNGEQPHFRAVDLDDAPKVYRGLRAHVESHNAFAAWCFMILCASRPSEALEAKWSEIDRDKRLWTLPASRMKSARRHQVPLSIEALAVLEQQWGRRTGDSVFPGRGGAPLSYDTFARAPATVGIDAATAHGWRSVFRDYCGDVAEDVPRDLAEAALAHSLGKVEASYRRRTAVEKRRPIMEAYSRWLLSDERKVIASHTQAGLTTSIPCEI
jgi:integrase